MSDGILNGLDPATLAEHFGEVDLEYTWGDFPAVTAEQIYNRYDVSRETAQLRAELDAANKRSKDAEAVVIDAAKLLQEIEWVYHADYRKHQCEICLEYKVTGHRADCALKRFIDKYAK